jgi:superfamily II DNA or RNA helicase
VRLESEHFATFVPADPPRAGALAMWGDGQGPHELDLVLPAGRGTRRRRVRGRLLPLASALPALLAPAAGDASASVAAWSAAATTGIGLVARGRLLPVASPDGYGAWRVGPLDAADLDWLRRIAAAMPPEGHALPLDARRPLRLRSPEGLVRELWDAIADTLVRTPAAVHATGAPAFAAAEPVSVGELAGWLAETDRGLDAGAQVQLRVELPAKEEEEEEEEPFAAVVQVRSVADPSLVVDAGELWSAPAVVLARLGERAETDLLLALRRGARAWPPLAPLLRSAAPTEVVLDEEQVAELLETGAEALGGAGIEVLWPAGLLGDGLDVRATVATPTPAGAALGAFRLEALLSFDWQVAVGGEALTAEEVAALAEAKRPLVRLRGRWVRVNRELLERLRRRRGRRITAAEALTAALTGSLVVDGDRVEFHAAGALADLVDRLAGAGQAAVEPPEGLRATLRPYQRRGLSWLAQMCELGLGGCLADDMGLGKTVQVIALHLHRRALGAGPTLVVCPTSLLGNWERELTRFAPGVQVRRYHGGDRHLEQLAADEMVLVTYGVVRRDRAVLAEVGWGLVVADEAQHAKNPLSRTARELRAIPAPARVALTGTPVENRLTELWSILDWTTPGLLGPLERFRRSVAVPVERYRDADAAERLARVVRPFLLRRRKSDPRIAPELPAKTETDRVVPLTAEQATLYEAVVRETLAKIASSEGIERRGLVLGLLTALKQICNHPAQYLHEAAPLPGRSGKLAALDELLDVILAEGEAALVFSQYVEMCGLIRAHLADRGVPTLFLHGRVPARRREEMVARFQDGGAPVFLLSLKAGGVGLNLTRATHVVHYDRWWNPAVEDQATDRAYRIGQDRPVQVHRLVTEGTLEDRIAALLASKRDLAEAVVGAGEAWITELSDAELGELVSLQGTP